MAAGPPYGTGRSSLSFNQNPYFAIIFFFIFLPYICPSGALFYRFVFFTQLILQFVSTLFLTLPVHSCHETYRFALKATLARLHRCSPALTGFGSFRTPIVRTLARSPADPKGPNCHPLGERQRQGSDRRPRGCRWER